MRLLPEPGQGAEYNNRARGKGHSDVTCPGDVTPRASLEMRGIAYRFGD